MKPSVILLIVAIVAAAAVWYFLRKPSIDTLGPTAIGGGAPGIKHRI